MHSAGFQSAGLSAQPESDLSVLLSAPRWRNRLPTISVVIPAYNRARDLERTLPSIFGQTVRVHEVVIVDDGSTDDTAIRLRALRARHPEWKDRLTYIRRPHQGKSAALNEGLRAATGDWIAFNDSDDEWIAWKLELQLHALALHEDAQACFTDARFVNNPEISETAFESAQVKYDGLFGVQRHVPQLFGATGWSGIYMQTVLVSAEAVRAFGAFDESVQMSMDNDFVFRLSLVTPLCFVNLPLVEVDRTEGRTGLMTVYPLGSSERLEAHARLLTNWLSLTRHSHPVLWRDLLNSRSKTQSSLANWFLLRGDVGAARTVLKGAIRDNPRLFLIAKYILAAVAPGRLKAQIERRGARQYLQP